jgi:signal transduction histidine kinase
VFTEFGRLAQELAHEIRNPLTAINARLYKLQKRLAPGSPELRDTAIIEAEIKRLDQMLENFRKLGWTAPPQTALLNGETVLREICELLQPELERRAIEVSWEAAPDLELQADRQQLKQVLINLVKNAAEEITNQQPLLTVGAPEEAKSGTKARGAIWVRMRRGKAQIQAQTVPSVIIEVEDSGPGIPEHVRERMFEPFFSTKEHGTGLGLPIAARIVAQHGGALEFESRSGQGSTFRVLLPEEAA